MVTVFLRGGLGNQMFQYATGLNLAKKNHGDLLLDTVHLRDRFPRKNFTYRNFDLDIFTLTPQLTTLSRAARALPIPGVWLGLDLFTMHIKERFMGATMVFENEREGYDPEILKARGDLILYGRWENEKYFLDAKDDVREAFRFKYPLTGEALNIADHMRAVSSVSVHVRRGDFAKSKKVQEMMGAFDVSYYERAAAYLAERLDRPHFFIFSDDADWAKENLKLKFPATYLDRATAGPKASDHLQLMSLCKNNIIANSTFSWWGAWLNRNLEKRVVAPARWYGDGRNERGIVPNNWIRI